MVLRFRSLIRRDTKTFMPKIVYVVTLSTGNRAPLLLSPDRDRGARNWADPFVRDQEASGESAVVFVAVDSTSTSTASSIAHLTSGVTDEGSV